MRSENALISRSVSETIKDVVRNHQGKQLTVQRAAIIKEEFLLGMKKQGFDWNATEISIEIMADGGINLQIPPALLNPTTH